MLQFNELRITADNQWLVIDVSVIPLDYYKDIVIDSIIIDTQDTFIVNGPSSNSIYTEVINSTDTKGLGASFANSRRNVRLQLPIKSLDVSAFDTMFFVYVKATGTPAPDTPCGQDKNMILGTAINLQTIYKQAVGHLKNLQTDCGNSYSIIDLVLRIKALELCVRTCNYIQAIKYWNKFFKGITGSISSKNCGCNGTNN